MGKLVVIRHHESEWNKLGKWTGLTDVHMTPYGISESKKMGELVKDFRFDYIFTSVLVRAKETLDAILSVHNGNSKAPIEEAKELNERDYGDYTGKNKWEMKEILGEEEFKKIRRSWDGPIPNGESLKMVYDRTVPYFIEKILPILREGKNVLIVAHGNSIRSIMKYIENISDEKIADTEIDFGEILIYDLNEEGKILNKEKLQVK